MRRLINHILGELSRRRYRVEQVFLIQKPSGMTLCHIDTTAMLSHNPDCVGGMLSAFTQFIPDSFGNSKENVQTMQVGELSAWFEHGPLALLAAVIRGRALETIRSVLHETLERIHIERSDALGSNDLELLNELNTYLESCLHSLNTNQVK